MRYQDRFYREGDTLVSKRQSLVLFLSVDIVGSTKIKQEDVNGPSWLTSITGRLNEIQTRLDEDLCLAFADQGVEGDRTNSDERPFNLWKKLGDELIFTVDVHGEDELLGALRSFVEVIRQSNDTKSQGDLPVKGSAWVAGFPVWNKQFRHISDENKTPLDYIGPSVDLGFRVGKLSSARKLTLTADLAYLVFESEASDLCDGIRFDGRKELKGIADHLGYPHFWIDLGASEYERAEEKIIGSKRDVNLIKDVCRAFLVNHGRPRCLPFYPSDLGGILSNPEYKGYAEQYDEIQKKSEDVRLQQAKKEVDTIVAAMGLAGSGKN